MNVRLLQRFLHEMGESTDISWPSRCWTTGGTVRGVQTGLATGSCTQTCVVGER